MFLKKSHNQYRIFGMHRQYDCMFLIKVLYDLIYCQEKYFQTHFINKVSDKKAILNYPPKNYCKPSSSVGDIFLKTWAFIESTLDEL